MLAALLFTHDLPVDGLAWFAVLLFSFSALLIGSELENRCHIVAQHLLRHDIV